MKNERLFVKNSCILEEETINLRNNIDRVKRNQKILSNIGLGSLVLGISGLILSSFGIVFKCNILYILCIVLYFALLLYTELVVETSIHLLELKHVDIFGEYMNALIKEREEKEI